MKRFCAIFIYISICFYCFANIGQATAAPEAEYLNQIVNLLQKQYGEDFEAKLQKLQSVKLRLTSVQSPRALSIQELCVLAERQIILENLESYVRIRYIESGRYQRDDFHAAYISLSRADPKADTHPSYLSEIKKRLLRSSTLREDSENFRAFVYISFFIHEKTLANPLFIQGVSEEWKQAWRDLESITGSTIGASESERYEKIAQVVARISQINPHSARDLGQMRQIIWNEKISPHSYYFQAYLFMRYSLSLKMGRIHLSIPFQHALQTESLSCEANSATDLINYYRRERGVGAITEEDFLSILPIREEAMVRVKQRGGSSIYIWGDPDAYFVGRLNGKQSSNRSVFSGYGISASGIAPSIESMLLAENLRVKTDTLSENRILSALGSGNPVMFWYMLPTSTDKNGVHSYSTRPVSWQTPEGKSVNGYIGQHTGLIVGADFDESGHIRTLYFYQGRKESIEVMDFQEIQKTSVYFPLALYVERR